MLFRSISLLGSRLKSIFGAFSSDCPIYVDLPGVASSSRVRQRPAKRSVFDYLVPNGNTNGDYEHVAAILSGEKGRPIRSAGTEVEKLRRIKSAAEIKVMRRAADISSAAHGKVRNLTTSLEYCSRRFDAGHEIRRTHLDFLPNRILARLPL